MPGSKDEGVSSSLLKPGPPPSMGFAKRITGGLRSYLSTASLRMKTAREKVDDDDDDEKEGSDNKNGKGIHGLGNKVNGNGLQPVSTASSMSIGTSRWPHARELSETFGLKMRYISSILAVTLMNGGLIAITYVLADGTNIKLSPAAVHYAGGVILELILLVTNTMTVFAVDLGISILLAIMLTSRGYSMAACGFMQTNPVLRLSFTNELSLNSPCRKTLERVAFAWILLESLKLVSPIGATGLDARPVRMVSSASPCIVFDGSDIRDRNFPTFWSAAGVAEFIYGTALGCMRSEFPCTDKVGDGDTIVGPGYHMYITSTCSCHNTSNPDVVRKGILTAQDIAAIRPALNQSNHFVMLSTNVTVSTIEDMVSFSIIPGNIKTCGGLRAEVMPVCYTEWSVRSSRMERQLPLLSLIPKFKNFKRDRRPLPSSRLSDLIGVDPSLQDVGIETMVSILLRAGFQRNFKTKGSSCPKREEVMDTSFIVLRDWSNLSILPALQAIRNPSFFMTLLSDSPNAPRHVIWQNLDLIVKIGENIETAKLVRPLKNGRIYA
ncbi:hypothetical protein BC829DRAFT_404878 [Chytridium lagenaria]|nr:hypothetical protein BC829DRAFT_404878 [Chytridium lagenaria]